MVFQGFLRQKTGGYITKKQRSVVFGKENFRPWDLKKDVKDSTQQALKYNDAISVCENEELWKPFSVYINNSRINMNIRQVLNKGQQTL